MHKGSHWSIGSSIQGENIIEMSGDYAPTVVKLEGEERKKEKEKLCISSNIFEVRWVFYQRIHKI
jgi:hypothetical protein